jgi:hypothetical protein
MRHLQAEIFALLLAVTFCGFILCRLLQVPLMPQAVSHRAAARTDVKTGLCRLARAATCLFRSTGHYAAEMEPRSAVRLPAGGRLPYHYIQSALRFPTVSWSCAIEDRPPALLADQILEICTVTAPMPKRP